MSDQDQSGQAQREWWIDPTPCDEEMPNVFDAFSEHPGQGPLPWQAALICVVPKSAYSVVVRERDELRFELETEYRPVNEQVLALRIERDQLRAEVERLRVYEKTVYDYVQCTGNTSPKTLGYHVAEVLVMDHKALRAKLDAVLNGDKEFFIGVIEKWQCYWMNQRQNSEEDYQNYWRRAFGVDANMKHHLARMIVEALASLEAQGG